MKLMPNQFDCFFPIYIVPLVRHEFRMVSLLEKPPPGQPTVPSILLIRDFFLKYSTFCCCCCCFRSSCIVSCSYNSLIYCWLNASFRKEAKESLHSLFTCFGLRTKELVNSTGGAGGGGGGDGGLGPDGNIRGSGREVGFGFGGTTIPTRLGATTCLENGARTELEENRTERTNADGEDGDNGPNGVRLLITSDANKDGEGERSSDGGGAIDPLANLEFAMTDLKPLAVDDGGGGGGGQPKRGSNSSECLRYGQVSFGKASSISETDIASTSALLVSTSNNGSSSSNSNNKPKQTTSVTPSKETTVSLGKSKSPLRSRFSMFHFHHNKGEKVGCGGGGGGSSRASHQIVSVVIEPATSNGSEDGSVKSTTTGNANATSNNNKKDKGKRSLLALRDTSTQEEEDQLEFTSIL